MPAHTRAQKSRIWIAAWVAWASSLLPLPALASTATKQNAVVDECTEVRHWAVPQVTYSNLAPSDDVLRITRGSKTSPPTGCEQPRIGSYCSVTAKNLDVVSVYGPSHRVTLDVPSAPSRPLEARWVNPKLLYLEMWFNPHNGAFWLFDTETDHVVFRQLQDDGIQEWLHCRTDPVP